MSLILNFHGIGGASREFEQGEQPYWLEVDAFTKILDVVAQAPSQVMITFDDGNASDVLIAAPELRKRGLKAHFFVLAASRLIISHALSASSARALVQLTTVATLARLTNRA